MRTSNPALNAKAFERFGPAAAVGEGMTVEGVVNRTAFLLLLLAATATWTWSKTFAGAPAGGFLLGGLLGGFAVALVTIFKPAWSPVTAPIYAALEGLALGAISALFQASYPGIVIQAVALTFGVLFALLVAYRSGVVIASLNLVLDFDFIEHGAEHGAPKFMEWYAAFGLMVTLIWLYLEILRLLSKLRSR